MSLLAVRIVHQLHYWDFLFSDCIGPLRTVSRGASELMKKNQQQRQHQQFGPKNNEIVVACMNK